MSAYTERTIPKRYTGYVLSKYRAGDGQNPLGFLQASYEKLVVISSKLGP